MLENGALWSRRVRTWSHGWCADARCVWMFRADFLGFAHILFGNPLLSFPEHALILAIADGDGAARGLDRLLGELNIRDLLDRRLPVLLDVAILGAVVDRPLRAGRVEAGIDRPDAIFGQHVEGISARFTRFARRFCHERHNCLLSS